MYPDITGIVLAGGKSSRMGQDKALLKIGGKTMAERAITLLQSLFPVVALSTNHPDSFSALSVPTFSDQFANAGPLGGIHAAMTFTRTEKVFILGCDIPMITPDVIRTIVETPSDDPIVITRGDGYLQPMCGLYHSGIAERIAQLIVNRNNRENERKSCGLLDLTKTVPTTIINIESALQSFVPGTFFNMNRPDEYNAILQRMNSARQ